MGATTRQLILTVLEMPAALPSIILGMRLAMGLAWMSRRPVRAGRGSAREWASMLLSLQQNDDGGRHADCWFLLIGVLGPCLWTAVFLCRRFAC
jgi:hypothetical protein